MNTVLLKTFSIVPILVTLADKLETGYLLHATRKPNTILKVFQSTMD